ncbi:endonuclease/exonuclease/phosphatase family protein [Nitratireductor sp. StC3]|uniref:endonuclease/exonuclease/phosphatase family protein n=1 Tax=Nitratireductor sp. StC3 TaxID=2126741 RepID=UPI000D0D99C8|nr:endonuclease/exonuclease/phosphatase family protein [Nitratireductor sp. StC3]PSM19840.1 hypothetical protein C7T96_01850 [Nitratireductor sp. StC3]
MRTLLIALVASLSLSTATAADTLRIGSWNIQDLHHEEGVNLRSFDGISSVKRTPQDFALLEKYRDLFGRDGTAADVIALQEIGTKAALERLFPKDTYDILMSPRWRDDDAPAGEGDVYTAVAVRKDSGVALVRADPFPELSVLHSDGRATRAGTGALLEAGDEQFWFLSVHLKSSCATNKNIHTSSDDDCETLWKQVPLLADWVRAKRESGIPFVIAGDFNRRFRQMNFEGTLWEAINGVGPDDPIETPWVVPHPQTVTRLCPTRKGTSTQPIDWIVLDTGLAGRFVEGSFWERRFARDDINAAQGGSGLSDHCPISIDLDLPG